jgi:FAD/FMN-containing dehydrogenase
MIVSTSALARSDRRPRVLTAPNPPELLDAGGLLAESAQGQAWVRPADAREVADVLASWQAGDVPTTPRRGGTELAGAAVPAAGDCGRARPAATVRCRGHPRGQWRPDDAGFVFPIGFDGIAPEAPGRAEEALDAVESSSVLVSGADSPSALAELWRWRPAITGLAGGCISENAVHPLDGPDVVLRAVDKSGRSHGVASCSYGQVGDGNVQAALTVDPARHDERPGTAADDLLIAAIELDDTTAGEDDAGVLKAHAWRSNPERSSSTCRPVWRSCSILGL